MKCPKCGAPMRTDYDENQWYCLTEGCMTFYYARDIPGLIAERDALAAEVERLRAVVTQLEANMHTAAGTITMLRDQRHDLRGTLDKYAEETNWSKVRDDRGQAYYWFDPITYDCPEPWVPAQDALK